MWLAGWRSGWLAGWRAGWLAGWPKVWPPKVWPRVCSGQWKCVVSCGYSKRGLADAWPSGKRQAQPGWWHGAVGGTIRVSKPMVGHQAGLKAGSDVLWSWISAPPPPQHLARPKPRHFRLQLKFQRLQLTPFPHSANVTLPHYICELWITTSDEFVIK